MITQERSNCQSRPIKWHGGKHYLAQRIVDLIPPHTHYVEPFFGSGAVLFAKPMSLVDGHSEVINDLYGALVNFWRVIQSRDLFPEFCRRVQLTPFSESVWQRSTQRSTDDELTSAVAFFVRFRQSRQGLGKDFATMSRTRTRRGMNEQVSSWLSAIDGLHDAHARLMRVAIFSESATKTILREDGPKSFFYCDPPYYSSTRVVRNAYACEMTHEEHVDLLDALSSIQGTFVLSGYGCPLYEMYEKKYGWKRTEIRIDNKASSKKHKPRKIECLWSNF